MFVWWKSKILKRKRPLGRPGADGRIILTPIFNKERVSDKMMYFGGLLYVVLVCSDVLDKYIVSSFRVNKFISGSYL